ncbi:MAG: beta-galactosidase [Ferruginibacter sp.]|nr:beta-galactosidase [Ferruginibacter sp.]
MKLLFITALFLMACTPVSTAQVQQPGTFVAGKNEFLLNGKPFVVRAAELHYSRIPAAYWEQRIQLCKAMGMNTICIYLFWNLHEQQQGVFDFSGQQDVAAFVRLIQKNGMYCIVRPGPYVCAEWDMGGLPWWLLKKKDLQVRSIKDELFMESSKRFLNKAAEKLAPLQVQNGGNIIMVQVENEYGVWGNDSVYMGTIRNNIRAAGFNKVQLFRCDWSSNFYKYKLDSAATALNFGAGSNIENQFKKFKEVYPDAPLMCGEYWTGWFDQWGRPHETRGINTFIGSLKDMLDRKISFSLYMAHGGTSFGPWSGANAPSYAPTVSSYDYDAPINEAGRATDKFFAIRELIKNYLQEGESLGNIPGEPSELISLAPIQFMQSAALFSNLPAPKKSADIQPMEMFDQGWGRILYRTNISPSPVKRRLVITEVHDWASIFVNGKAIGKIDRRIDGNTIEIPPQSANAQLDILVEATGRVNYGKAIIDRKGITEKVELSDGESITVLKNWLVYNLPVNYAFQKNRKYIDKMAKGPAWYKAAFTLVKTGDTYLNLSKWGKGMVWVNGYNLGRFWNIGPTQTMFLPGCWLKKGLNEIIVFDLDQQSESLSIAGTTSHIYKIGRDSSLLHRRAGQLLDLSGVKPLVEGTFQPLSGWKEIFFPVVEKGRYFCFEALNAFDAKDQLASVAEMEILLEDGTVAPTLKWKVLYADSEEITASNSSADKVFDMQESVIWQTASTIGKTGHPHNFVIDMGDQIKIKGFRILPRGDKSKAGMVKDYRFYLSSTPFKF